MVKRLYIIICMLLVFVGSNAQTANQLIREGNKLFSSKNYAQAEILYHKAIDKDGSNAIANYNLGRCLQAQKKNEEAKKLYDNAAKVRKKTQFVSQAVIIILVQSFKMSKIMKRL